MPNVYASSCHYEQAIDAQENGSTIHFPDGTSAPFPSSVSGKLNVDRTQKSGCGSVNTGGILWTCGAIDRTGACFMPEELDV